MTAIEKAALEFRTALQKLNRARDLKERAESQVYMLELQCKELKAELDVARNRLLDASS